MIAILGTDMWMNLSEAVWLAKVQAASKTSIQPNSQTSGNAMSISSKEFRTSSFMSTSAAS